MKSFATLRLVVLGALALLSLLILSIAADLLGKHGYLSFDDAFKIPGVTPPDGNDFPDASPIAQYFPSVRVMSKEAAGIAVAISVITLVIVVPLLVFTRLARRSEWQKFLTLVWVELFWVALLWILWLVTAVKVEAYNLSTILDANPLSDAGVLRCNGGGCAESRALKGLAWLTWILVFGYLAALASCSAVSVRRDSRSFIHMDVDQILSPDDTLAGPPTVEVEKA